MRLLTTLLSCLMFTLLADTSAYATDVDGPPDCERVYEDHGDAPEGIPAYPGGIIGKFPTCSVDTPAGTQELFCPAISTPPGPTGRIRHGQTGGINFWFGCYGVPGGEFGLDSETDGKVATPASGFSSCSTPGIPSDCVEAAFGMTFDQDECYGDGSDAALTAAPTFVICTPTSLTLPIHSCSDRTVNIQVLVDYNEDGDWNDNFDCGSAGCAYEWAVKNYTVALTTGCNTITTPPFLVGPRAGNGWLRISMTVTSMADDFPWKGHGSDGSGAQKGGETEDYPVVITSPTPTETTSWGRVKTLYR